MLSTIRRRQEGKTDGANRSELATDDRTHTGHQNVRLRERWKHFTWAWYTLSMSTGGLALLLSVTPHRFHGLDTIGKIVFIFDLVCFILITLGIIGRFMLLLGSFVESLRHPTEGLFYPTAWLSISNIISCTHNYGEPSTGPWIVTALRVLFWLYLACTFLSSVAQYWFLFTAPPERLTVQSMTPAWILPIFPVMLSGTIASSIASQQPPAQRMAILVGGVTFQGLGWMVSFLMYAAFIHRLIQYGLPAPNLRPGMFIAVGPPAFTGLALIGMSHSIPSEYGYFAKHPTSVETIQQLALFVAIFLWALSFWFFSIALVSVLVGAREMSFHLVWWAFVFPNIGFTIATSSIGEQLKSEGILWVASAMTILIVVMWLFVFFCHVRAVLKKQILMPGKDEDKFESRA